MQSIFRYPGGKTRKNVRDLILSYAPEHFSEYREPFVGGGGIFFAISVKKKRWINDANKDLISVYNALKERPDDFIAQCRTIDPPKPGEPEVHTLYGGRGKKYNQRLRGQFYYFALNKECDQALRYFFINRTVWGGRVNYDIPSRLYYSNPAGWNIVRSDKLGQAAKVLKDAKITAGDFEDVINVSGENTWIYCDPPYFRDTLDNDASKLYQDSFSEKDHERLFRTVSACSHRVCISYDDVPEIVDMYSGWNIHRVKWTYCGTSSAEGCGKTKRKGDELLITNYDF